MPVIFLRVEVGEDVNLPRIQEVLCEDLLEEDDVETAEVLGYEAKIVAMSSGEDQRFYGPFLNLEAASEAAEGDKEDGIVVSLYSPDALKSL